MYFAAISICNHFYKNKVNLDFFLVINLTGKTMNKDAENLHNGNDEKIIKGN